MSAIQLKREYEDLPTLAEAIQKRVNEAAHTAMSQGGQLKIQRLGEFIADMFEPVKQKTKAAS
jgi:hypothetical protein